MADTISLDHKSALAMRTHLYHRWQELGTQELAELILCIDVALGARAARIRREELARQFAIEFGGYWAANKHLTYREANDAFRVTKGE